MNSCLVIIDSVIVLECAGRGLYFLAVTFAATSFTTSSSISNLNDGVFLSYLKQYQNCPMRKILIVDGGDVLVTGL